jgi:hypothetical protein
VVPADIAGAFSGCWFFVAAAYGEQQQQYETARPTADTFGRVRSPAKNWACGIVHSARTVSVQPFAGFVCC